MKGIPIINGSAFEFNAQNQNLTEIIAFNINADLHYNFEKGRVCI